MCVGREGGEGGACLEGWDVDAARLRFPRWSTCEPALEADPERA